MRRSQRTLDADLRHLAVAALEEAIGPVSTSAGRPDLIVDVDGQKMAITVETTAYATLERVETLKRVAPSGGGELVLVVADRINAPARKAIVETGWGYLDADTGSLFLRAPGIRIDTTIDGMRTVAASRPEGIVGRGGRVVAYEILRRHFDGDRKPIRTTTSRSEFDLARSSTSDALQALAAADLIVDGTPVVPALFWELAKVWAPPDRRWLASLPDPEEWQRSADPNQPMWRLGGLGAAIVHGAPAVGVGEVPAELYVPGPVLLSIAARRYGLADPISAVASVAVPSAPQVTGPRTTGHDERHRGWPVVHPVAAALDLAALGDARSQQTLDEWRPAGETVWHDD